MVKIVDFSMISGGATSTAFFVALGATKLHFFDFLSVIYISEIKQEVQKYGT